MSKHSQNILRIFEEILNENQCYELSREHNFIQRSSSKLKGHEFIKVMIVPSEGVSDDSLNGLCSRLRDYNPEANLSAQALCERINSKGATSLIRNVFFRILFQARKEMTVQSPQLMKVLGKFQSVIIEDSTVMELNEKIFKYEGTNRNTNSKKRRSSQIKIDLIHELFSNQIIDVQLLSGKEPDQSLAYRILKFIQEGDLVIRDLGYFVLPALKIIDTVGAFFLSRLLANVKVFLRQNDIEPIDLQKYVSQKCKKKPCTELNVFLGDIKVPARLVLYKAPKEVVRVRLHNAKRRIKQTGRIMSKGKEFTINYSAFVTNAPTEMLAAEMVGTVYQLRWEIELIFKQWKSLLKMDVLEGINENRIDCLIWGRLCTVLLLGLISQEFGQLAEKLNRELSLDKLIKYVLRRNKFGEAVQKQKIEKYIEEMEKDVRRLLCKDKRQRMTMRGRVILHYGYYGVQHTDTQCVA